jgi:hypothetical protein
MAETRIKLKRAGPSAGRRIGSEPVWLRARTYEGQTEKQPNKGVLPPFSDTQHDDLSLSWKRSRIRLYRLGQRDRKPAMLGICDRPREVTAATVLATMAAERASAISAQRALRSRSVHLNVFRGRRSLGTAAPS